MMRRLFRSTMIASAIVLLLSSFAAAQDGDDSKVELNSGANPTRGGSQKVEGWDQALSIGANLNLNSNNNVVGQVDGFSALFGFEANGGIYYLSGPQEWRNTLRINESWARTPTIEQFLKNNDTVDLQSLYNYYFLDWSGAFGRASLESKFFATNQVTAEPETYEITRNDGRVETRAEVDSLRLSDPFGPTSLQQAGGVFASPLRWDELSITTRFGLGVRERFADGVLTVNDDAETDPVEVEELENIYQGGTEAFLGLEGTFQNGRIGYQAGVTAFLPVVNNDSENRSAIDLFSYEANAAANVNVVDGVSASYNLKLFKDPQFLDKLQVQNSVVLTVAYQLIERKQATPPLEEQLEEARNEAEAAREKIEELEETMEDEEDDASESGSNDQ